MSQVLTQASHQWATRPDDERFTSLTSMLAHFGRVRQESRAVVVPSKKINLVPEQDNRGLQVTGPNGHGYAPTNWAFGQIAALAEAPAGYLRTMPAPIVADCLNYGLQFKRAIEDVGVLLQRNSSDTLRAATGPNYGRVWNEDIVKTLTTRFGDGLSGDWRVPGEFGRAVEVTKANTTLFASDRDMFVFLADEVNRVTIANRREGKSGSLARGFFVWNSEVGSKTLGIASFLFDYACSNRMVWGAEGFREITIRHTSSAPDKWLDEVTPVLKAYAEGSAKPVEAAIQAAQAKRVDDVEEFLAKRFGKRLVQPIQATFQIEERRPIETLWDITTAVTAYAKGIAHQDARVALERQAGDLLDLAA
jgi:hypothetical protein